MTLDPMNPVDNPASWASLWRVYARKHGGIPFRYYQTFAGLRSHQLVVTSLDTNLRPRFSGYPWLCDYCGGPINDNPTCPNCGA